MTGKILHLALAAGWSLAAAPVPAAAESVLESLWQSGRAQYSRTVTAALDVQSAESALRHKGALYPVSLATSADSSVTHSSFTHSTWQGADTHADLSVTKPFPGGLKATAALDYTISRSALNPLEDFTQQNTAYQHVPAATLALSQSLRPFWLQGMRSDPNTALLRNALEQKKIAQEAADKTLVMDITSQFIQFRQNERLAALAEKKLAFHEENVQALQECFSSGESRATDVWRADEERWNCRQSLDSCLKNRQAAYEALNLYCGNIPAEQLMGALPQNSVPLYADNIAGRMLQSQLDQLKTSDVLAKQESAPALALKGAVAEYTKPAQTLAPDFTGSRGNVGWSFTVALDFSNLGRHKGKLRKEQYNAARKSLEVQLEENRRTQEKYRRLYECLVRTYKEKLQKSEEICSKRRRYAEAVQQDFADGGCSRLDMLSAWNEYETALCTQQNDSDLLWYYTWLKTQNN